VREALQDESSTQPQTGAPNAAENAEAPVILPPGARYRMLARLWCLLTPVALWLLFRDRGWLSAASAGEAWRKVRLEQWVAVVLVLLHGWFWWRGRALIKRAATAESCANSFPTR